MNGELILTIIFAIIALFVILKLRSVLGRRTGHERPAENWNLSERGSDNVVQMPDRGEREPVDAHATPLERGVAEIKNADPNFDTAGFVEGAKAAFEMIVHAFADGERETLEPLLAPDLYESFESAIAEREEAGETMETELDIRSAKITDAELSGNEARVTVTFESDQRNVVRDKDGKVIDGDPTSTERITDIWTFSRDVRSADPNWTLVETAVAD